MITIRNEAKRFTPSEGNTMSVTTLPTTAGSIVSFDDWADEAQTEMFRYVITLVPGEIDPKTGELLNVVWTDAHGEDGTIYDVDASRILAGNPEIIFEAPEVSPVEAAKLDMDEERLYGAIVVLDHPDYGTSVAVFVPSFMDEGEISEAFWVNSYGAYFTQEEVTEFAATLLVKGAEHL